MQIFGNFFHSKSFLVRFSLQNWAKIVQKVYNTTYYIVNVTKMHKKCKYPMGILWLSYGYPMVGSRQ